MAWFKIYAGMSGSMGGAVYHGTYEYADEREALSDAYELALETYQSYEGYHGIMSWSDVEEDLRDSGFITDDLCDSEIRDMIAEHYQEEVEGWITYCVKPAEGPNDQDEDE